MTSHLPIFRDRTRSLGAIATIAFIILSTLPFPSSVNAQSSIDKTIRVTASTSTSTPYITLNWPTISNATNSISIWRREKGNSSWTSLTTALSNTATSYPDSGASPGVAYEYSLQCSTTNAGTAYGCIVAGYNLPLVESRGKVILLVDSTLTTSLSPEITQWQDNLAADGWIVYRHDVARQSILATSTNSADYAPRLAELQAVRTLIQNDYNSAPGTDWALFILGHVPVPYSGEISPDGHGTHAGAWATDTYYADVNGTWTDTGTDPAFPLTVVDTRNNTTALTDARNINIPGDGKFDQLAIPTNTEIQCGRVDLSNMNNEPIGLPEVEKTRQYLMRDNLFRRNLAPYKTVAKRALIDDNFGYFGGEAFASSGWRTAFSWVGRNAGQVDSLDWFDTLGTTPMLLAYGCGGGSLTSSVGIGYSFTDFNKKDSKAVFNMLFGSWFGDFDSADNFLRSPIAGTANSLGLTCVWSGRGYFHLFHMALGDTIGYCTRFTQNATSGTGDWPNSYTKPLTANLMGDPTLRLHSIAPPTKVTATSTSSGITLNWIASTDTTLSGYHVYRSTSVSGPFTRITGVTATASNPTGSCLSTSTLTYTDTDSALVAGTDYTYLVKAVRMESSPSGTYANQSLGEAVTLTHLAATPAPAAPTRLTVSRTGTNSCTLTWDDNSSDETGFQVERRDPATGNWSLINSPAAGVTTTTDSAATVAQIVHYRVRATGSSANSPYSAIATDYNRPGLFCDNAYSYITTKSAVTFNAAPRRFNGSGGSVSINYATSAVLATAGTDYTTTSSTVTWAHGESGTKSAPITILSPTGTQSTKIVKITYTSPTNGLTLNTPTLSYLFITDPAATTLPAPWATTTIGSAVYSSDAGYAEIAGNTYGLAVRANTYGINTGDGTGDSLRYLYQPVTGDFQMTVRLNYLSSTGTNVRSGILLRATLTATSATNALFLSNSLVCARYSRATSGTAATLATPYVYASSLPHWLRVTRTGTTVASEQSHDGVTWTAAATSIALANIPTNAYIGLAVTTDPTSGEVGALGYARFDNVTLYTVPAAVTTLTASTTGATASGQLLLNWTASSAATSYLIERSTASGTGFTQIATVTAPTVTYTDTALTAGTTYYYRVKAINPAYQAAAYSPEASATPYLPATTAGWNYTYFGSESPTGNAAPAADPDGDSIPNLLEYALGLNPTVADTSSSSPNSQIQTVNLEKVLTYTFTHNKNAKDLTLVIEVTSDPATGWTSLDPFSATNQLNVLDNSPANGLETITVKDTQPVSASTKRFIRLKITGP